MARNITVFVMDNNQKPNYDLMQFLEKNIKTTTACGNIFIPRIISKHKQEQFIRDKHISKVPAIIYQNKKYEGMVQIKGFIRQLCTKKNYTREKSQNELDTDDLLKYQQSVIESSPDDEEENEDDNMDRVKAQVAEVSRIRADQAKQFENRRHETISQEDSYTDSYHAEPEQRNQQDNPQNIILSERGNNITDETDEDIYSIAHEEGGPDSRLMDALMEKIGVSHP